MVGAVIKGGLSRHQAAAQDWRSRLHQLEQPRGPPDAPHNLRDIVELSFFAVNVGVTARFAAGPFWPQHPSTRGTQRPTALAAAGGYRSHRHDHCGQYPAYDYECADDLL